MPLQKSIMQEETHYKTIRILEESLDLM